MPTPAPDRRTVRSTFAAALVSIALVIAGPVGASHANLGFGNVPAPTIAGSGVVGTPFEAVYPTEGIVPQPETITYDWYLSTGQLLQSGMSDTYVPTVDDVGQPLYLVVTIESVERINISASPFSATVRLAEFTGVGAPTVTGSGIVGTSFTATFDETAVTPVPENVSFTWFRVDSSEQVGVGATLLATPELVGTPVYVIAELTAPGTQGFITDNSAFSATVRLGEFTGVTPPAVFGSGFVGTTFTAVIDSLAFTPEPLEIQFTWYRADTNAVVQVGGETLAVTSELLGTPVYVVARLSAPNTQDFVTTNSAFSQTVQLGGFLPGAAPRLEGRNVLQGTLEAVLDTAFWVPTPTAIAWQWYLADGTEIAGASGASVAMTPDLVGEAVYAVATVTTPDTAPYVIATPPSGRIAAPSLTIGDTTRVVAGGEVTVRAFGLLLDEVYELELRSTPVALGSARSDAQGTITATVTIPQNTPAGVHRIVLIRDGAVLGELVVDVAAPPPALAATGAEGSSLAGVAALALIAVAAGVLLMRRHSAPTTFCTMSAV